MTSSSTSKVCRARSTPCLDRVAARYPYSCIDYIDYLEEQGGLAIYARKRYRVFTLLDRDAFVKDVKEKAKRCGITIEKRSKLSLAKVLVCPPPLPQRRRRSASTPATISSSPPSRSTRSPSATAPPSRGSWTSPTRPSSSATPTRMSPLGAAMPSYTIISMIPLQELRRLVRQWNEPQQFSFEFNSLPLRKYSCPKVRPPRRLHP